MSLDFCGFNQSVANSASVVAEISRQHEELLRSSVQANRAKIERENRLVAGAEASIAQKELLEQQVEIIRKQNDLLADNYTKLKELYNAQVVANKEAKEELKQSKRFNVAMMIIAFIAMLAAIAGPIVTIIVSR